MSLKMTKHEHRERCIKTACGHVRCYLLTLKKLGCKMAAEDIERILDGLERIAQEENTAKQPDVKTGQCYLCRKKVWVPPKALVKTGICKDCYEKEKAQRENMAKHNAKGLL